MQRFKPLNSEQRNTIESLGRFFNHVNILYIRPAEKQELVKQEDKSNKKDKGSSERFKPVSEVLSSDERQKINDHFDKVEENFKKSAY